MKTFTFYTDSGHGWVAVPFSLVSELGIIGDISVYSYMHRNGNTVYLEEDCDFGVLADKLKEKGIAFKLKHKYSERSAIRNYPNYPYTKR